MKRIIIPPDSFKGSLTSTEVANAMEEGIKMVFPNCEIVKTAIADGGEGTTETLVNALSGEKVKVMVHDPLMRPIEVEYGLVNNGKTAVIEMAWVRLKSHLNNSKPCLPVPSDRCRLIPKSHPMNSTSKLSRCLKYASQLGTNSKDDSKIASFVDVGSGRQVGHFVGG